MNILIVNWQDIKNPLAGGAEVHLHEVFSRLVRMGHRVTLVCSSFSGAPSFEDIKGLHVIRKGGRYLFNFRFMSMYLTRFRNDGFDIVIDDMNKIPFLTPLYVRVPLYGVTHHLFGKSIFLEVNAVLATYVYVMERMGYGSINVIEYRSLSVRRARSESCLIKDLNAKTSHALITASTIRFT